MKGKMQNRKLAIIVVIFSALIVGLGVSFAFGNTVNPNCPDEIKQAINNWDSGLDARDAKNQSIVDSRKLITESRYQITGNQSGNPVAGNTAAPQKPAKTTDRVSILRELFLSSLITLTFNTPIHSQILVSNAVKKLFTVAKHYLRIPNSILQIPDLAAIFTALKRFFEKIFLILLGLILPLNCLLFSSLSHSLTFSLSHRLYYRFNNLRL
jgi:hypothetical protein